MSDGRSSWVGRWLRSESRVVSGSVNWVFPPVPLSPAAVLSFSLWPLPKWLCFVGHWNQWRDSCFLVYWGGAEIYSCGCALCAWSAGLERFSWFLRADPKQGWHETSSGLKHICKNSVNLKLSKTGVCSSDTDPDSAWMVKVVEIQKTLYKYICVGEWNKLISFNMLFIHRVNFFFPFCL